MQTSTTPWHHDWVVDPDPLAEAQARHRPSGFGVSLKTIGAIVTPPGQPPYVAAIYTDDSRPVIDRMFGELGPQGCRNWIEQKQRQAQALWRLLGLDVDPAAELAQPLPCQVTRWRNGWSIRRNDAMGSVDLKHDSGWATRFVYAEAGEDGRMGWCGTVPDRWVTEVSQAECTLGERATARLRQEAEILLMEEGYFHCSSKRLAQPFGDSWRTLWHVREKEGEQWLVHASGLAVTPVYGQVDDDPAVKGWTLHLESADVFDPDSETRRRVGQKAWDRVHDQGWRLCVEMGYVAPPGETVH